MKKYPVESILKRAEELNIILYVDMDNTIHIDGPPAHLTEKLRQVVVNHQSELLTLIPHPLCFTCLDEDKETLATCEDPGNLLYCAQHRRAIQQSLF